MSDSDDDVSAVFVRQYVGTELVSRDGYTVGNLPYYIQGFIHIFFYKNCFYKNHQAQI